MQLIERIEIVSLRKPERYSLMDLAVSVEGWKELEEVFRRLPASTQRKASRPALRAGGAVIRDMASNNIKGIVSNEATGLAARSVRVYSLRKLGGDLRVGVMIKRGTVTSKGVRVGLYASVLEYGKENQPPRSWIRKAGREGKGAAFEAVATEMNKRMVSAVQDAKL